MPEFTNSRLSLVLSVLLLVLSSIGIVDIYQDAPQDWQDGHVLMELVYLSLSLSTAIFLWLGWRSANFSLRKTRQAMEVHQAERDAWREQAQGYLQGLGAAIELQLKGWGLTASESETALFILKGFSHKEIGLLTSKSERTVRQHAIAVYRKSGLAGRAELSAYFLEDLLLPTSLNQGKRLNP